ncbi:tripartite tricarboxylate transporter permease [Clostridiaceae bacterium 35-E11]
MIIEGILAVITSPVCLMLIALGVIVGIIFGSIPGLSATMAVVLFLPMSFGMDPINGISLLIGLYIGGISGGLISAILLKIPGTPSSIATVFDGGPMAERGEAGKALGAGILYSFLGGLLSIVALIFISPYLAKFALKFTPVEYFSIALFSLTIIASLSGDSMVNGLLSGLFGITAALIGIAPLDGFKRFTFGLSQLGSGLLIVTVLIGLFAICDIFEFSFKRKEDEIGEIIDYSVKGFGVSIKEFKEQFVNFIRSSLIGLWIGILPGVGGSTSSLLAYSAAKNASKHPEKFGTGIVDGIVASESSNNAMTGGSLIPLLTLGIPGNTVTAMLLGGLMIHGISPGPLIFVKSGKIMYAIFTALIVGNIAMLVLEYWGIKYFVKLMDIPKATLFPIITVLCAVGAFASNSRVFDVYAILIFGLIGFLFNKASIPKTPFIIGFILGPIAEVNLRRALMASEGSLLPFITRPISAVFVALTVLSIVMTVRKKLNEKKFAVNV